tara:strand:+ start:3103 stop:3273 length:171 start_codon:yes stop_codon:yes gene_type:complete
MDKKEVAKDVFEVLGFNSMTLMTVTFADIENVLKLIVLILSIFYTLQKMYHFKNKK